MARQRLTLINVKLTVVTGVASVTLTSVILQPLYIRLLTMPVEELTCTCVSVKLSIPHNMNVILNWFDHLSIVTSKNLSKLCR